MPVHVVAEIGSNHHQDEKTLHALILAASKAGADAVKLSLYTPEQMAPDSDDSKFVIKDGPWAGQTLYELYQKAYMPTEWFPAARDYAESLGLKVIAGVYHPGMVPIAEEMGVERYKISSFEFGWDALWDAVLATKKPIIASTGAASLEDIQRRVGQVTGNSLVLLKCTSQYPATYDKMNLKTLASMKVYICDGQFEVGLSDHTLSILPAIVATAMGASMIEKHLRFYDDDTCLDAAFSIQPCDFGVMVDMIRRTEAIMGTVDYTPTTTKYIRRQVGEQWYRTVE